MYKIILIITIIIVPCVYRSLMVENFLPLGKWFARPDSSVALDGRYRHTHTHTHWLGDRQHMYVDVIYMTCFVLGNSWRLCLSVCAKMPDFWLVSYEHVCKVCVCNSHFT